MVQFLSTSKTMTLSYCNIYQHFYIMFAYILNTAVLLWVAPLCVAVNATLPPTGLCYLPAAALSQWAQDLLSLGGHFGLPPPGPETLPLSRGRRARPPWCWLAAQSAGQWAAVCEPWLQAPWPLRPSHVPETLWSQAHERTPCAINSWAAHREQSHLPQPHTQTHTHLPYKMHAQVCVCVCVRALA